jgi:hypothetical protein
MAISLKQLQQNYNQYVYSDNDPTHEYFNMGLFNEYTPNNTSPRTLKFNQVKQAPIIDKSNDYYLSIIRWNLQSNLPVLIPDIQIKPNVEAFTGLTDYQLALMYDVQTTTQLNDTFGFVSSAGKNYLGIYKTGDFGTLKTININFPPDNSASVDYDNVNNGLDTSGNGSIYIISGGIIKVFDKVTNQVLLTLSPASGESYKYLTTDKGNGDFYFGTVNNSDNTIKYSKAERTGSNTWNVLGTFYDSPSDKNTVAGIAYTADGTLNELSSNTDTTTDIYFSVSNSNIDTLLSIEPTYQVISSSPFQNGSPLLITSDSLNNSPTIYMASGNTVYMFQNGSGIPVQSVQVPTAPSGFTFQSIGAICSDASGNLYVACVYVNGSVNRTFIQSYIRAGSSTWTLSTTYNVTPNPATGNLVYNTILSFGGTLIAYILLGNGATNFFTFTIGNGTQILTGNAGSSNWLSITGPNYIYRTNSTGTLLIGDLSSFIYTYPDFFIDRFLGFDANGYLLIHRVSGEYQAIDETTGDVVYSFTPADVSYCIVNAVSNDPISYVSNVINQWDATGSPSLTKTIDNSLVASSNPNPSSLWTDSSNLYAVYNNLNNETYIILLNPVGLVQLLKNSDFGNLTLLNGLIGVNGDDNLLLSNVFGGVNLLTPINRITLNPVNNYIDPVSNYNSSSMLSYPFEYFETTTSYVQAGDTTTLIFIPETINLNLEAILNYPRDKEELFNNPYFYIKYVDTFCRMINDAIKTALSTIGGATWTQLPYFEWDSVEAKIVYNQPTSIPTGNSLPTNARWYLTFNQPLYNLMNTFRFKYYPTNSGNGSLYPESAECRYLLDTNILFDNAIQPAGEYLTYVQQISSVQTWTPIQSWVFSSTIIPIESQLTGQPQNLNDVDPTTQGNIYKQQAITKVLTDFIVPLVSGVEATNQNVFYTPAGEYRLVDLLGGASLNQLSLEVKWRDKYGVDHDMYIDAGASANLLVLLRKKTYNSRM